MRRSRYIPIAGLMLMFGTGLLFGQYIGSDDFSGSGGSREYPKAQAFVAPASEISHIALYMYNADGADTSYTWRVMITTGLPKAETPGDQFRLHQGDLSAKTIGTATVTTTNPANWSGWVDVNFTTPVPVTPGKTYYIVLDSYLYGVQGSSKQWKASPGGAFSGPYSDGLGWIYVYNWSYNSNTLLSADKHRDYAFRVYYTPETPNAAPVADAGTDVVVSDSDKNGSESVSFSGSGSTDPDGTIANYVWRQPAAGTNLVSTYPVSRQIRFLSISGTYAYVTDVENGLHVVDIADPLSPTIVGHYYGTDFAWDIAANGNYVYITDGSTLKIINVSNPAAPSLAGSIATTASRGVAISGNYAYVADGDSGLKVVNISNPVSPSLAGSYNTTGGARRVAVRGNYAFVGDTTSGLQIIDISNPAAPSLAGTLNTTGLARGVAVSGKYAYVADSGSGLQIIDISNPAAPILAGTVNTPGYAWDVDVVGNYAYVGDDDLGLQIVDVSNPSAPVIVGARDTETAYGVVVNGNYAYVADHSYGLQIIDVSAEIATGETPTAGIDVGTHVVYLTVTDNQGATNTDTVSVTVQAPPNADAGGDQTVTDGEFDGESVTLVGSASTDIDGTLVSYIWRESAVQIATGVTPSFTFAVGIHDIELTVTDDDGLTDTDTVSITIDSPPSVANLLCDGMTDPTNVTDYTPLFGWSFLDADLGDSQSAFQIRVGSTPGNSDVWDYTDASSANSISYGGSTDLAANTTYYWSVRVWDQASHASDWAADGDFVILDIGLRVFDGTDIVTIAVDHVGAAYELRIHKDGTTYGIILVDQTHPDASNIRVRTPGGTKALKKMR